MPYLKSGVRKDFVLHTKGVIKAVEMIVKMGGKGDERLLVPAAILHDVGWSNISRKLQKSKNKKDWNEFFHDRIPLSKRF